MNKPTLREWLEERIEETEIILKAAEENLCYLRKLRLQHEDRPGWAGFKESVPCQE